MTTTATTRSLQQLSQTQGRDLYPAHTYTYLACDLMTDDVIAELPLSGVQYTTELNGVGTLRAFVPVNSETKVIDPFTATEPCRTIIYVDRDGVIEGAYIIWTRTPATGGFTIAGEELISYYQRRLITDTLSTDTVEIDPDTGYMPNGRRLYSDQRFLVWSLLDYATLGNGAYTGIDINPLSSDGSTGINRSATYYAWEQHRIYDTVASLAGADNGFDFGIEVGWNPSANGQAPTRYRRARVWYPHRGQPTSVTGLSFYKGGAGSSIISYDWPEDGTSFATRRWAVGAGEGVNTLVSTAVNADLLNGGYPLLEDTATYDTVIEQATLDAHTRADLNAASIASTTPTFQVAADLDPVLGSYNLGDTAMVIIDPDERFPNGYEGELRIVTIDVTAATGPEIVKLSCVAV